MLKAMESSEKDMIFMAVVSFQRLNKQVESDSNCFVVVVVFVFFTS